MLPPAVDEEVDPGDVGGVVTGEEHRTGSDVVGFGRSAQRNLTEERVFDAGRREQRFDQRVRVRPGETALTRMPWSPSSIAAEAVRLATPAFAAE